MNAYPSWAQERIIAIDLIRNKVPSVALFIAISILEGMSRVRYPEIQVTSSATAFCNYLDEQWNKYWIALNGLESYPMPGVPYYGDDKHLIQKATQHIIPQLGDKGYPGASGPPFYMVPFSRVLYSLFRKPLVHEGIASDLVGLSEDNEIRQDCVMLGPARFCNSTDGRQWMFDFNLIDFLLELPLQ